MKIIKNIFEKNIKIFIGIIIGIILSGTSAYAATILFASNQVSYDNTASGLTSTDVQEAIDELYEKALLCDVPKLSTTMALSSTSGTIGVGESTTITVTTNGDGEISCSPTDGLISTCSVNQNTKKVTVTGKAGQSGSETITISQAEGVHYGAATKTFTLTISEGCPGPGCYYSNNTSDWYTTWNLRSHTPTTIDPNNLPSVVSTNYQDLVSSDMFIAMRLNSNNQVEHAYACGIENNTAFCIEGTYNDNPNKTTIQTNNLNILTSIFNSCSGSVGSNISCSGTSYLNAYSASDGKVTLGRGNTICQVEEDGDFRCGTGGDND